MSDHNVPRLQTAPGCCTASTMLGAIATSFAFCFVLMVLFLYVRYLLIRRRRRGGVPQEAEQPKLGLDPTAIAQLPSFTYKRGSLTAARTVGSSEEMESTLPECSICLSSIEEGEQVRLLPNCRHMFHKECIDVWLSTNASCPVCRGDPEPRNAEHHELFISQLQLDVFGEGVSSPLSEKDRSSGEIERVIPTRSDLRQLHDNHVVRDLERQL
ncbi:hypothetical protein LUZ62_031090 [Rhynchospora pubera]|uniref:RING-type E3 ubiquitin transferase n=1 Tax=Rhynchospora pubera TaxID=906938 RepID=A0AAV8HLI7_9POAL|nr:hypothetical protein LUZ62_076185 [Rhynchospora pubera]KAJ4818524.1 hypothetical protein LUZ62_031090 [Rhynchospora pubera]